jgi:hypothetical protein
MLEIEDLAVDLPRRAANAVLSVTGGKSRTLRQTLSDRLGAPAGSPGSLVAEPVLEGAYPWLLHPGGWGALPDSLYPGTGQALQSRMGYQPYAHQVESWALASAPEPSSIIISSGTGSGKTECFLGALLNHLLAASDGGSRSLTGVRGLMLYPLNALINSQQERLSAWLSPLGGRLRYCLYNGLTPEGPSPEAERRRTPEQVLDRRTLRTNPPPLLVTNLTMLEYMLVRRQDVPILEQSRGLLEYVILDEVHTYVGAQATELALLLRRVALAFGRDPRTIRVIATSATLGTGDRHEQAAQLRQFLRDLTGAADGTVHAIIGERAPLDLPPGTTPQRLAPATLSTLSGDAAWQCLASAQRLQAIARRLHGGERIRWSEWRNAAREMLAPGTDVEAGSRALLGACARAKRGADGHSFLPTRLHIFERTLGGLWACCDRSCPEGPNGDSGDWAFGKIFLDRREFCDTGGSPVLEVRICQACGTETLVAEEADTPTGTGRRLRAPMPEAADDDFALELDLPDPGDDASPEPVHAPGLLMARWILAQGTLSATRLAVRRKTGEILDAPAPDAIMLSALDADFGANCPTCGEPSHGQAVVRPFRVGAPFMLGAGIPVALGAVTADPTVQEKPFSGRRLLTFTDARQGTARLSAKLQADAERAFLRAFVYHTVQSKPPAGSSEEIDKKRKEVAQLEAISAQLPPGILARARVELADLEGSSDARPISWPDMRDRLAQDPTLLHIKALWELREDDFQHPGDLAHFLLLREFLRRAVRGNSAETMGLARLVLPQHQDAAEPPVPARQLGLSGNDWRDLLSLIVTHFLRLNTIVSITPSNLHWIDRRLQNHVLVGQFDDRTSTAIPWPAARGGASRPSRIVSLLAQAAGASLDDRSAREIINETLDQARQSLSRYFEPVQGGGFRLDMRRLSFARVKTAWLCPVTRRVLDVTLKGLSPYPNDGRHLAATPIVLPDHPLPFFAHPSGPAAAIGEIEAFLASDPEVSNLRELGVWTNLHEPAALFAPYYRSAEHSAQQPSQRLRSYEDMFKNGDINVLNCSTTMEMGVDIGSIEVVVNANVPPSIASYRQRVGRAGRRDQPIAVGLTICKERPLDRRAFDDPARYLDSLLKPPRVRLDSPSIVRRHAHAFLLSAFLKSRADDALHARIGEFFGFETPPGATAPWLEFLLWCDATKARLSDHGEPLAAILGGTPVTPDRSLFERARDALIRIADERRAEWDALKQQEAGVAADNKPAFNAIRFQKRRASEAYLLSELAAEGFLPGYGFPTGIVPLVTDSVARRALVQREVREDARSRSRDYPSRKLDIALFEYAPGTTLVLDGLAYTSAGITLNWRAPANADGVREIQALRTAWRCRTCGAAGVTSTVAQPDVCAMCGSPNLDRHEYIAPKGFAVDIREKPHDDTVQISHFPRNPPWVHASGASWQALPDGGRVRASAHGIVYLSNSGEAGHGYAVCLQCGRTAAETEPNAAARPLPHALAADRGGHRPLRGAPKDEHGICPGTAGSFSIKRNLELGHALRTAVVEVQLYGCRDADTARAIAVALREACAIELGIEPDEMGFAATPALTPEGTEAWCAVVYDRASGGAGFAATIADEPIRCLNVARDLLDCAGPGGCGQPGAERFCPRCLLSADTQHMIERCDRLTAFQVLDDLVPRLEIAAEDRLFGAGTELQSMPLADALIRRVAQPPTKTVVLWLDDDTPGWELDEWPARTLAETWGPRGVPIRFAVRADGLLLADLSVRQSLARLVQRCQNAELVNTINVEGSGALLAAIVGDENVLAWASRDASAGRTAAGWGRSPIAPVVRGFTAGPLFGESIDLETLLSPAAETAIVEIAGGADGPALGFGQRLRRALDARAGDLLRSVLNGGLKEIVYTDRYLFSPLSALLLTELVGAFAGRSRPDVLVHTRAASKSVHATPPWQVQHDWTTQSDRVAVLQKLLGRFTQRARVDLDDATPHRRTFVLKAEAGVVELTLDQGVGPWQPADRYRFDFGQPPQEQAQALLRTPIKVTNAGPATFVVIRKLSGA